MADKTIFERIYEREIPVYEVYRNDEYGVLAFLDQYPATRGHVLIIPKEPVDQYIDVAIARALQLQAVTFLLMGHLQKIFNPKRVTTLISGFGVAHLHVHALPSYESHDTVRVFDFERTEDANKASDEELTEVQRMLTLPSDLTKELDDTLARLAAS